MKRILIAFLGSALVFLLMTGCDASELSAVLQNVQEGESQQDDDFLSAHIDRVIDGDTMKVTIGKKADTIRLLLVDSPETKKPDTPVQPFGLEASAFSKKMLTGKDMKLEIDTSERDKYDRLLVYLWLDEVMFNELLVEKGFARVAYVYEPNTKYEDRYRAAEQLAKKEKIGIWSLPDYVHTDGFYLRKKAS